MGYSYYSNDETRALREKVLEFFGGKCMNPKCLVPGGCSDKRCLQIDHIKAVGKHRLIGAELYFDILENPNSKQIYQLLCANCNWIKRHENKETRGNIVPEGQQHPLIPLSNVIVRVSVEQVSEPCFRSLVDIGKAIKQR